MASTGTGALLPGRVNAVLEVPLLTALGRYSYAMYVYHVLILQKLATLILRYGDLPTIGGTLLPAILVFDIVATSLTFAAAWLSWSPD